MWLAEFIRSKDFTLYGFYKEHGAALDMSSQMFFYNCRKPSPPANLLAKVRDILGMNHSEFYQIAEANQRDIPKSTKTGRPPKVKTE